MTLNSAVTASDLPELFISTVWNIRVNDVKYNEANVNIEIMGKGPYIVKGKVNIFDAGGNELDVKKEVIALCQCGNSLNKPFCDGSHVTI